MSVFIGLNGQLTNAWLYISIDRYSVLGSLKF